LVASITPSAMQGQGAFSPVIRRGKPARVGLDALFGVETDADSNGNECAEGAVHPSPKLDPLSRGFSPCGQAQQNDDAAKGGSDGHSKQPP